MMYEYRDTDDGREIYKDGNLLGTVDYPIENADPRIVDLIMSDANLGNPQRQALMAAVGGGMEDIDVGETDDET